MGPAFATPTPHKLGPMPRLERDSSILLGMVPPGLAARRRSHGAFPAAWRWSSQSSVPARLAVTGNGDREEAAAYPTTAAFFCRPVGRPLRLA
jgi:hypothetical protein